MEPDFALLDRYLAGDCTPDEAAFIRRWLDVDPATHGAWLADVADIRTVAGGSLRWDTDAGWREMARRIGVRREMDVESAPSQEILAHEASHSTWPSLGSRLSRGVPRLPLGVFPSRFGAFRKYMGAIAAGVTLMIAGTVIRHHVHTTASVSTTERTYATHTGQQAVVTLSDGSRMTLAPATTAHIVVSAATQAISVTVDGEALFRVVHRPDAPFTVQTRNAVTRVLGTQFLVRQYATDRTAQIVVTDGRVSLRSLRYPNAVGTVMAARTLGTVDDSGRVDVTPDVVPNNYTAWTTGQLVFQETPARQIVADIGRAYGVDLRLTDSTLARHTLTWSIPVTRVTLAGALEALSAALDAHVVRSGDTIMLVPGRATSARPRSRDSLPTQEHTYGR